MTPGIHTAKKAGIVYKLHEYNHESSNTSYGAEAADKMGVPPERVFKTLVVNVDQKALVVGVIPVSSMLSMKRIAKEAGAKKASMAIVSDVERATGYVLGGVSPLGQKKRLKTIIDSSAKEYETIFVSAGRRGLEMELNPEDLAGLTDAVFVGICQ